MDRYYSDTDDEYYARRQRPNSLYASGWQSPMPTTDSIGSSSIIRIVVECPFGRKKCDYAIDKSERGRLIVTARRRRKFKSDHFTSNNQNDLTVQTFTIPFDADVDHLRSHVDSRTNNLIVEIPHHTQSAARPAVYSTDLRPLSSSTIPQIIQNDNQRKLEYRIDCRGYRADELDVFIENQDLVVYGKTKRSLLGHPTQEHVSKEFSRRIPLPNTVDITKVISFLDNGELRVEAPLKRDVYHNDERVLLPSAYVTSGRLHRTKSPTTNDRHHHYRRREHFHRHRGDDLRPLSPKRRVLSAESVNYPYYRTYQDWDYDENSDDEADDKIDRRQQRTVHYRRHASNRRGLQEQPIRRRVYSPTSHFQKTRKLNRHYPAIEKVYYRN